MSRPVRIAEPPPRFPLSVRSVDLLADEVYRLRLDAHPMSWEPGDCVTLYPPGSPVGRPYSFSGPPDASYSEFWVRRFPDGRVSDRLCGLQAGDPIEASPPFGWFRPLEPVGGEKLYVATGTGIAPYLSALSAVDSPADVRVLWGVRHELPTPPELAKASPARCVSREDIAGAHRGRVTDLLTAIPLLDEAHVYLCGLDLMIEEAAGILRSRGVADARIHRECFFTGSSS